MKIESDLLNIFFYSYPISKTGILLAKRLEAEYITSFSNLDIKEDDALIRWGREDCSNKDTLFSRVINKANAISLNKEKAHVLLKLYENDVRVPRVYIPSPNQCLSLHTKREFNRFARELEETLSYPMIGRKFPYHSHGNWIYFIKNRRRLKRAGYRDHYIQFIKGDLELRAHVLNNKLVRLSRKVPVDDKYNKRIKNTKRGWLLSDLDELNYIKDLNIKDIEDQCIKAMKVIDLDFGAIDIIIENSTNLPYILELNSAPSLNKYGRRIYEIELRNMLGILLRYFEDFKRIEYE